MEIGDLVKVYTGTPRARRIGKGLEYRIGVITGTFRGYYVPVQIGNTWDIINVERLELISACR